MTPGLPARLPRIDEIPGVDRVRRHRHRTGHRLQVPHRSAPPAVRRRRDRHASPATAGRIRAACLRTRAVFLSQAATGAPVADPGHRARRGAGYAAAGAKGGTSRRRSAAPAAAAGVKATRGFRQELVAARATRPAPAAAWSRSVMSANAMADWSLFTLETGMALPEAAPGCEWHDAELRDLGGRDGSRRARSRLSTRTRVRAGAIERARAAIVLRPDAEVLELGVDRLPNGTGCARRIPLQRAGSARPFRPGDTV